MQIVWIVLPSTREMMVVPPDGESRHAMGEALPSHAARPGLVPAVERLFRQLG